MIVSILTDNKRLVDTLFNKLIGSLLAASISYALKLNIIYSMQVVL